MGQFLKVSKYFKMAKVCLIVLSIYPSVRQPLSFELGMVFAKFNDVTYVNTGPFFYLASSTYLTLFITQTCNNHFHRYENPIERSV